MLAWLCCGKQSRWPLGRTSSANPTGRYEAGAGTMALQALGETFTTTCGRGGAGEAEQLEWLLLLVGTWQSAGIDCGPVQLE